MNKIKSFVPFTFLLIVVAAGAYSLGDKGLPSTEAAKSTTAKTITPVSVDFETARQNILKSIQTMESTITSVQIEETPLAGIYWVVLPGNESIVMSGDGKYFLGRGISEFKDGTLIPLLSDVQEVARVETQKEIQDVFQSSDNGHLIYPAEGQKKGEVFVFTDVNCGYCRKFHRDVPELNQAGIEVHYLAGPFFSKDRVILEKIWCSENPLQAMTQAKNGQKLDSVKVTEACQNTVSQHIALGEKLGIRGTPAIYIKDGEQVGGYVPAEQLIARFQK